MVRNLLLENKTVDEIKHSVNEDAIIHVLFKEGVVEEGSKRLPENYKFQKGVSEIYKIDKNHFITVNILKILPAEPKKLDETKGQVLNDYQNYLEKKWVLELHNEYKVEIDENALHNLKQVMDD